MITDVTHREVEDFLFMEADLLDTWQLEDWFKLFTPDARYLVPAADLPADSTPETSLFYIADDAVLLHERVKRLYKRNAHAEWPHSKTRHFVSNVRIMPSTSPDAIDVRCSFMTHRHRGKVTDMFVGSTRYQLVRDNRSLLIREKRCKLDVDNLYEQGRISILL